MTYKDFDSLHDLTGSYDDPPALKPSNRGPVQPYPGRPPVMEAYDPVELAEAAEFEDCWNTMMTRVSGAMLLLFAVAILWMSKDTVYRDPNTIWEFGRTLWAGAGLAMMPSGLVYLFAPKNKVIQYYPTDLFLTYAVVFGIIYGCQKLAFMIAPAKVVFA